MENLASVHHIILILSGKGGVGKSTMAVQLALALKNKGKKVGILDVDLCGPSIPKMFDIAECDIRRNAQGWIPVFVDKEEMLGIMSMSFLLPNESHAVIWRGPKKTDMIRQFLANVYWGETDYLIIDTPPGTSDEHMAVVENVKHLNPDGAILVTTPQECTNIFSSGGGKSFAEQAGIKFLDEVNLATLINRDKTGLGKLDHHYIPLPAPSSELDIVNSSSQADKYGNSADLEACWAVKAYDHADVYYNLITSVDPSILRLTKVDDEIYSRFRKVFPDMIVDVVDEDVMKNNENKVKWREFIHEFEGMVEEATFGTLLRIDCRDGYTERNSMFCVRAQFLAIEIARNREYLNTKS